MCRRLADGAGADVGVGPAVALLDVRWPDRARHSHAAEPLTEAAYRQGPLSAATLAAREAHPQFGAPQA